MEWANNIPMTEEEERQVLLVQEAGCKCKDYPLLGYIPNQGPRCRLCGVEAFEKKIDILQMYADVAATVKSGGKTRARF